MAGLRYQEQHVDSFDADKFGLDIDINNNSGIKIHTGKPILRNVFDSKHDMLAKLVKERRAYEKAVPSTKTKSQGEAMKIYEQKGLEANRPPKMQSPFENSGKSSPRSFDQDQTITPTQIKAWTTINTSKASAQSSNSDLQQLGVNSYKDLPQQPSIHKSEQPPPLMKKKQDMRGLVLKQRNQIIGIQQIDKIQKLKKRLGSLETGNRVTAQKLSKSIFPDQPNEVLRVSMRMEATKKQTQRPTQTQEVYQTSRPTKAFNRKKRNEAEFMMFRGAQNFPDGFSMRQRYADDPSTERFTHEYEPIDHESSEDHVMYYEDNPNLQQTQSEQIMNMED